VFPSLSWAVVTVAARDQANGLDSSGGNVEAFASMGRPSRGRSQGAGSKATLERASQRLDLLLMLGLAGLVALVFAPLGRAGFIHLDDDHYVYANPMVRSGLSWRTAAWAFTAFDNANWHPLTWLSHLTDVSLFGLDAGAHHLTSVTIHAAAAAVLFLALRRLTGRPWRSAFVAALFAVHPQHVESVAWISERKDVLSGLFAALTLWAYARWLERRSFGRYVAVAVFLALGLLAKPMLVTMPFVLLLVDVWPGRRLKGSSTAPPGTRWRVLRTLVLEKAPLLVLAAASSAVTYVAQQSGGAVHATTTLPIPLRIANALVSYAIYLVKTLWPSGLGVFYPHPVRIPGWQVMGAGLLLLALSALAVRSLRRHPVVFTGWFLFVGMLVPVIGLVKVGEQARADRYTYLPLVGVFLVVSWVGTEVLRGRRHVAGAVALTVVAACALVASAQASRWRDSETLFRHTLAVTEGNALVHNNLGVALSEAGRAEEARALFAEAVRLDPRYPDARGNLGFALLEAGEADAALLQLEEAVRLQPDSAVHRHNLGLALARRDDPEAAVGALEEAVRLRPEYAEARNNLGVLLDRVGRSAEAEAQLREAVRLRPAAAEPENNLGLAIARQGRVEEAVAHFRRALALQPGYGAAQRNLERAEAARAPRGEENGHSARRR